MQDKVADVRSGAAAAMAASYHSLDALAVRSFLDGLEPKAAQPLVAALHSSIPSLQIPVQVSLRGACH